jgi:hypothetical protein
VSSYGRNTFTHGAPCLCLVRCPFTHSQQPRITARCTFGAEIAHDLALVASGLLGHLAQVAPIPEPGRTRRMVLLVPPYLRRRKSTVRTFGTEGQHHSVGLFLHNKNSHNLSSISVFVKSSLQSFPRRAEAVRGPTSTAQPDVVKSFRRLFSPTVAPRQ